MKSFSFPSLMLSIVLIPSLALANSDWSWTTNPTPGAQNEILDEEGETQETYSNGDLSSDIILSEVMPNPEGTDNDVEWIEIYNSGTTNIDLGNWQLDDEEEGSDPYIFPSGTIIEAQDFLVIYRVDSEISLNNDADEVRLFDYEGTLQDSVSYTSAPEGQSYARISMSDQLAYINNTTQTSPSWLAWVIPTAMAQDSWTKADWQWTDEVTQGAINPAYQLLSGEIKSVETFNNRITIDQQGEELEISLEKLDINDELKESIFQEGNWIKGYARWTPENLFILQTIEESQIAQSIIEENNPSQMVFKIILIALITMLSVIFVYLKKYHPELLQKWF